MKNPQPTSGGVPFHDYFTSLAYTYPKQTGNSTRYIFEACVKDLEPPITEKSTVHDNAAGPATATKALHDHHPHPFHIEVTDSVPAMIDAATDALACCGWQMGTQWEGEDVITYKVMDSHDLKLADNSITHSLTNFSIFTFKDPVQCLREIHRTLQPDGKGVALVSTWKRFAVIEVVHRAQRLVRPDLPLMKIPQPWFLREGYLKDMMVEAGFEAEKVRVVQRSVIIRGRDRDGLVEFMKGDFTKPARAGWTEEEAGRWSDAVDQAVEEEEKANEYGMRFEAWVALAKK